MSACNDCYEPRPFSDLRSSGLLWLINATVFHPRGYALALHFDDEGNAVGWSLMGDGSEVWQFAVEGWPEGFGPYEAMHAAKATLP